MIIDIGWLQLWLWFEDDQEQQHVGYIRGFRPEMDDDFIYFYPKKDSPSITAIKKASVGGFTVIPIEKSK
ncbi:hypothetical protein OGY07_19120 [Citrobacter sp. Cs237]|uniref:hypothetical protein n=1 Tax=Citrobacter sp. Cs237 TaxID=2985156 RepID=UPI0025767F8E|nr:hypothetical protein [Citrobacter sp. Cs237]MDM2751439.1 hypothetical protein [Citrobacter sp. Cs237]